MSKSNKYGYSGVDIPTQAVKANVGKFDPSEINELVQEDKWTTFGQLELIQTQVATGNVTSIEFTDLKENEYNVHLFTFSNMQSGTSGAGAQLSFNVFTSQYDYDTNGHYTSALQRCNSNGTFSQFNQVNSSYSYLQGHPFSSNANQAMNGYWYFYNFGDSTKYTYATGQTTSAHNNSQAVSEFGSIMYIKTRPVTKMKFKLGGGTTQFTDGSIISLYGIKEY